MWRETCETGKILRDGVEVRSMWREYFEQVLNVEDVREANINVSDDWRMPPMGELNERATSTEEEREAVNEIKLGKAPMLDGFPVECLNKGGMAVLEWLVRLLNASFDLGVPMDWGDACHPSLYKGNCDKCECSISRCIPLVAAQAVRWSGTPKVARSWLTQCSKSSDLQPTPNFTLQYVELRGYCPV